MSFHIKFHINKSLKLFKFLRKKIGINTNQNNFFILNSTIKFEKKIVDVCR